MQARLAECEVTVESLNSKLMQLEKSKTQLQVQDKHKKMQNMSIMKGAGSTLLVRDLVISLSLVQHTENPE